MADRVSVIEDILIEQVKLALTIQNVETRTVSLTEPELDKMIGKAPFCYIEYVRSAPMSQDEGGASNFRKLYFNFFIASKSLRDKKEGQRGSYELLEKTRKHLNGQSFKGIACDAFAGPFTWEGDDVMYDSPNGGTVYMQVFSTIETNI